MLKLHKIYFKIFIGLFLGLFIVISLEAYYIRSFEYFFTTLLVTFVIFLSILYLVVFKRANSLQNEIGKIVNFLKSLIKKDKQTLIESEFSEEFRSITKLLTKISNVLIKQNLKKDEYTKKLEIANNQKDEIISAISHEFKNPIAVINGYSETLLNDNNLPISLRKKFLAKIHKNGTKLTNLIDTLRLAIKLDENKQKLNFKDVDIYELSKEIIEDIKESYDREIKIFGNSTIIKADKVLLGMAIRNLIENGIKYSENEVLVMINNDFISVIDKGIGISKDDINKITQKFYRVSNNSWNNSLGLGLSIVSNIVNYIILNLILKVK